MSSVIGLIGVGMIGGSVVAGIKQRQPDTMIIGFDINASEVEQAKDMGLLDQIADSLAALVSQSDIVLLATPVGATTAIFNEIRTTVPDNVLQQKIFTDVGSVKGPVVKAIQQVFPSELPFQFVPGHPIAGSEKSGAAAANPNLFVNKRVILTPLPQQKDSALQAVEQMWQLLGANIVSMPIDAHDQVLAATSHAPHLLAYGFMHSLINSPCYEQFSGNSAGGLRDFTRIAGSDPTMWRDITLANKDAILPIMDILQQEIADIIQLIENGDSDALYQYFAVAKQARNQVINNG